MAMTHMTRRLTASAAVALLAAAVAGCDSGVVMKDRRAAASPSPTPTPKVEVFELTGEVHLQQYNRWPDGATACWGTGGYADLREGAPVVVRDDRGQQLALGRLEVGAIQGEWPLQTCLLAFTVEEIPESGSVYSVEVADRGEVPFDRADAEGLSLSIGG